MIIRTVLGDIQPETAGPTYSHEHLIIDSPMVADRWPHVSLPSVDEAAAEMALCMAVGVLTVVDAMPTGSGRDLAKLARVSSVTGVNVVASTGMHTLKYYERVGWANDPAESLADVFTSEIRDGGDGVTSRAGIIKVATTDPRPTEHERHLFAAGARAHLATGAPILTHCEGGQGGIEQTMMLADLAVPLQRVILSHTDKVTDLGYHRDLLGTGVNLVYDQALRQVGCPATTAGIIAAMWEEGFGSQILLGTDGARRSLWASLGGSPGLAWLAGGFPAVLETHGVGHDEVETMLVTNPARVLAFEP